MRGRRVTIDPNASTARPTGSVAVAAARFSRRLGLGGSKVSAAGNQLTVSSQATPTPSAPNKPK
ncbi:MAG: hypothetical protein ACREXP_08085 [Steroidobacteraceae bacterium]